MSNNTFLSKFFTGKSPALEKEVNEVLKRKPIEPPKQVKDSDDDMMRFVRLVHQKNIERRAARRAGFRA